MCTNQSPSRCMPALGPSSITLLSQYAFNNNLVNPMKTFGENHSPSASGGAANATAVASSPTASTSSANSSSMAPAGLPTTGGLVMGGGPQAVSPSSGLLSQLPATLDQYRLQLYNYAFGERLRYAHPAFLSAPFGQGSSSNHPAAAAAAAAATAAALGHLGRNPHDLSPFFLSYASKFDPRLYRPQEEPKPQHSYIGLIAMAILSSAEKKLVLSDIYQYILDNYAYFRTRGPGWRNSIRHNLSLNDCFIKAGRSANGKGHYWAIHPANIEDFKKGDFRRRKAQRKVRKHMGLAVDEEDSPTPPASPVTVGSLAWNPAGELHHHHQQHHHHPQQPSFLAGGEHSLPLLMMASPPSLPHITSLSPSVSSDEGQPLLQPPQQQQRKRLFDVASLLGRNEEPSSISGPNGHQSADEDGRSAGAEVKSNGSSPVPDDEDALLDSSPRTKRVKVEFDEDVDVVSEENDSEDDVFPAADSRPPASADDDEAPGAASTPPAVAESSIPSSPADLPRRPNLTPMIPTSSSALGGMWMRSVLASPALAAQHPLTGRSAQPNAHARHAALTSPYFNGLAVPPLPFLPVSIATSMNEQLTKYYEQVAEAMRLNSSIHSSAGNNINSSSSQVREFDKTSSH